MCNFQVICQIPLIFDIIKFLIINFPFLRKRIKFQIKECFILMLYQRCINVVFSIYRECTILFSILCSLYYLVLRRISQICFSAFPRQRRSIDGAN